MCCWSSTPSRCQPGIQLQQRIARGCAGISNACLLLQQLLLQVCLLGWAWLCTAAGQKADLWDDCHASCINICCGWLLPRHPLLAAIIGKDATTEAHMWHDWSSCRADS